MHPEQCIRDFISSEGKPEGSAERASGCQALTVASDRGKASTKLALTISCASERMFVPVMADLGVSVDGVAEAQIEPSNSSLLRGSSECITEQHVMHLSEGSCKNVQAVLPKVAQTMKVRHQLSGTLTLQRAPLQGLPIV